MYNQLTELQQAWLNGEITSEEEYERRKEEILNHYLGPDGVLTTYQNLVHIISTLCDLTTRPQLVDGIDFDKALDKTTTLINDVAKANIVGYYKS